MTQTLKTSVPPKWASLISAVPCISPEADGLTAYFKFDSDYSQRLTDHVTLYRSTGSDEIIGCRIKGISRILARPSELLARRSPSREALDGLLVVLWRGGGRRAAQHVEATCQAAGDLPVRI